MTLIEATNMLIRNPQLFTLDGDSVYFVLKPKYAGIYFCMSTAERRWNMHVTIGHWEQEVVDVDKELSIEKQQKMLQEFREAVEKAWKSAVFPVFANVAAIDLQNRGLATLHVQGSLSAKMWSLQNAVQRELRVQERSRRTNFHFSLDA